MRLQIFILLAIQICLCSSFLPSSFNHASGVERWLTKKASVKVYGGESSDIPKGERDEIAQTLFQTVASMGQIGSKLSQTDQDQILALAESLKPYSDPEPAKISLAGTHELLYSASAGGSSGALGPFVGKVTQHFLNNEDFINKVSFGSNLFSIELEAKRKVLDESRIRVTFLNTKASLIGKEVLNKETKGAGVWSYLFSGVVTIDGEATLLRVILTPSLFIIRQKIDAN